MHGTSTLRISSLLMPAPLPCRAKRPGAVHVMPANRTSSSSPTPAATQSIQPKVKWQPHHRPKAANKGWGIAFKILYAAFILSSILFITQARPRYKRSSKNGGRKIISHHFLGEVRGCCSAIQEDSGVELGSWGLCGRPETNSGVSERRAETSRPSKYDGDEGMFDVLLESPQILGGILPTIGLLAAGWVLLLRRFSVNMVFATELLKILVVVAISFVSLQCTVAAVQIGLVLAVLLGTIATKKKENLVRAARTIAHSVSAFHGNPTMLTGLFALKAVFLLHASLFVAALLFAFDVVEVKWQVQEPADPSDTDFPKSASCDFEYPTYVAPVTRFQCLYWIWFIYV